MKMIERKPYMQMLRSLHNQQIIKVVTGMRRSGKSTLLEMFADEIKQIVSFEQIQFYNFEDLDTFSIGDYKQIYSHINTRLMVDKMNYIFLDEVQIIENFERMVDSLFIKKNVDLYVTGSNANLLSSELATLLTGRYIEIHVLPFSFAEYYEFASNPPNFTKNESLADYIYNGALPQAINFRYSAPEQENDFIRAVLSTIVEKDIFKRHEFLNKQSFNKVLDFAFDSVGSMISPRSIADTLRTYGSIADKEAISNYLAYMAESYLLYKVPRYDVKGKKLLQTLDKYYLADTGLRKVRLGKKVSEDRGHLLENAVYLELRRRNHEVYAGKLRDKEIDFVVTDKKGYISYYQVAYSVTDSQTLERELAPLRAIRDSNPKYLLSADWDTNPVYDGIRKYNVINWLLGLE